MGDTRQRLLDDVARVLARAPGASMSAIAEAVGVGRATLHRYFPTREALIRSLALDALAHVEQVIGALELGKADVLTDLERFVAAMIPLGSRLGFLTREPGLHADEAVLARADRLFEPLAAVLVAGQREGYLHRTLPATWMVDMVLAAIFTAWEGIEAGRVARQDAGHLVTRTLLYGLVDAV